MPLSRRRLLAATAPALAAGLTGCVATRPTADAEPSDVFAAVEPTQSVAWGASAVAVAITLAEDATTDRRVRRLVAVRDGNVAWTTAVEAGETSVSAFLPVGATCTLLAVDADANLVDSVLVRVDARTFP